jgi:hypothetical protein
MEGNTQAPFIGHRSRRRRPRAQLTQGAFFGTRLRCTRSTGGTGLRPLVDIPALRGGGAMRKQTVPDAEAQRFDRKMHLADL